MRAVPGKMRVSVRGGLAAAAAKPLRQITDNLALAAGPDSVDAVHDLRVALRRVGALLRVSRHLLPPGGVDHLRAEMRWLRRSLGPVRDLDVLSAEIIPALIRAMPGESALHALVEAAARKRGPLVDALAEIVGGKRCRDLVVALADIFDGQALEIGLELGSTSSGGALDGPWDKFAHKTLRQRFRRIDKAADRIERLDDGGLHEIRIRLRTFRYLCDHCDALLPASRYKALRKALAELQDRLGQHNDAVNAPAVALELARDGVQGDALARAAGIIAGWGAVRREWTRAQLPAAWARAAKRGEKLFEAWEV